MTFYYDADEEELVGNNMFYDDYDMAEVDDDSLVINVDWIMEEGRGIRKLEEMRDAIDSAIEDQT